MNQIRSYLGGKVSVNSLCVLRPPLPESMPTVKRLLLGQGELAQIMDGSVPIRYLAALELKPGSVRGNHFHRIKREFFYMITGTSRLLVRELQEPAPVSIFLSAGDLALIETGVAHACIPETSGVAVEFSEAPFDPADVHRFEVSC
jgi:mannose-6-phosphate isomerase-like protein (cupin superfamily)